jgi:hypothetical protein
VRKACKFTKIMIKLQEPVLPPSIAHTQTHTTHTHACTHAHTPSYLLKRCFSWHIILAKALTVQPECLSSNNTFFTMSS